MSKLQWAIMIGVKDVIKRDIKSMINDINFGGLTYLLPTGP